jgi:hypothetical protein
MTWIHVDVGQPMDERVVLVYGYYRGRPFRSLGIYDANINWWNVLVESLDFILIEMEHPAKDEKVKVMYWQPFPCPPRE